MCKTVTKVNVFQSKKMGKETFVAIMAGGIGSRFWPLSRESRPKQFLDLLGVGKSMLQITFDRFAKAYPKQNILIVTSESYKQEVLNHLPDITPDQVISEPARKNTAPCILYAAQRIQSISPGANMIVTPADHFILEQDDFIKTLEQALHFLDQNEQSILTLGIQPTKPHTGYGYIQYEETPRRIKKVKTFTEKPTHEFAVQFLESGDFLWNSGIFLWSTDTIISSFKRHLPDVYDLFESIDYQTEKEKEQIKNAYSLCQNISIDYGVLEKEQNVYVIPSYFSWSDVGTWEALYDLRLEKEGENVSNATHVLSNQSDKTLVYVSNEKKLVVLQDVSNLIIVDTEDTLIICNKESEQKIKDVVHSLANKQLDEYL